MNVSILLSRGYWKVARVGGIMRKFNKVPSKRGEGGTNERTAEFALPFTGSKECSRYH